MMLKEHVIFVRGSTNSSEDITAHEIVYIRTKAINNLEEVSIIQTTREEGFYIMVIPKVQLRNFAIGSCKWLC